jgi:membrane protease YdiL (CAAX protease family)
MHSGDSTLHAVGRPPPELVATSPTVGTGKRRRFAIVTVVVLLYIAAGQVLGLGPTAYVLLGLPVTVAFQVVVARRSIRALWLRKAPPLRIDRTLIVFGTLLAAPPLAAGIVALTNGHVLVALSDLAIALGAYPAIYAMRALAPRAFPVLLWTTAVAGVIGIGVFLALATATVGPSLLDDLAGRLGVFSFAMLVYLPSMFIVEEVLFRGALDAYLQPDGDTRALRSAIFLSALWGLWHVPVISVTPGLASLPILAAAAILVVYHVATGLPLTVGWRRSGNLAIPGVAHTVIDAVRNALFAF